MENLVLLIISLMIIFIISYYFTGRDLMAPPVIMAGVFFISSIFTILNALNWNIDYDFKAYVLIITGILVFSIPFYIFYQAKIDLGVKYYREDKRIITIERWKIYLTNGIDVLILYLYYLSIVKLVHSNGYSGSNIQWYFRNLTSYEGTESLGVFIRLLIKFIDTTAYIYIYIFINNVIIYKDKIMRNISYTLPAFLYCMKSLMSGGRQDLLKMISFMIIVAYILNHQKIGWDKNISVKYIAIGLLVISIGLPLFYYAMTIIGRSTTRTMFEVISTYVGGSIQHFNQYIKEPVEKSGIFGDETFTPILNTLDSMGIIDYHNTVHLEYRKLGITSGNIYTFFRRPLHDFGILGMYIFTICVSLFFSSYYFIKIKYKEVSLNTDINIIIYSYILYWIVLASIEQYSMTIISVQTLITIVLFFTMWRFYFCISIKNFKLKIKKNYEMDEPHFIE